MVKYRYLGGWKTGDTFFTVGNTYKVLETKKNGSVELEDDDFGEYGMGLEVGKMKLDNHFEEVAV